MIPGPGPGRDAAAAADGAAPLPDAGLAAEVGPDRAAGPADQTGDQASALDRTGDQANVPTPDAAPGTPVPPAPAFDLTRLHRVEITVAAEHLPQLESRRDADDVKRVPCTIVFDGTTLANSGIRKKGGNGSWRLLAEKAAFSIKFNEFVKGQKLGGLGKLLLNNAVQDPSFLNEHLVYELSRRAGSPAPLTAHALVTFNGQPYGFFVVREAINDDFLRRSFGTANEDGNLYEGGEFIGSPRSPELKDEVDEMRTRADVNEVARLANTTPDAQWIAAVGAKLDIPSFLTGYAIEALIDHWDGYFFGPHNYYVYNHPGIGRFVFIVAGADSVLKGRPRQLETDPKVLLARKFLQLAGPQSRARALEIASSIDVPAMHARIDQVARLLRSSGATDQRARAELAAFESELPQKKSVMTTLKAWRPTITP